MVALGLADAGFGRSVEALGVAADVLDVLPFVRRTVVVQHGATTTSLWEPGWPVAECAAESLTDLVDRRVGGADALVVSGSLPPGLDPGLPARLAALATEAGVPTVLDLDDQPLALALAQGGSVLTPNRTSWPGCSPAPLASTWSGRRGRWPIATGLPWSSRWASTECWQRRGRPAGTPACPSRSSAARPERATPPRPVWLGSRRRDGVARPPRAGRCAGCRRGARAGRRGGRPVRLPRVHD